MVNIEFGGPKLFPVIHDEHVSGTLRSTEQVLNAGANGVFLINHELNAASLLKRYREVTKAFPQAFVGLNFLDMRNPCDVYTFLELSGVVPDAVWTDWYPLETEQMTYLASQTPCSGARKTMLFAGVSHKGATHSDDPFLSAQMAASADQHVDFVTTTGPGTGYPAPLDKLLAMREAIEHAKLAVASGVAPDNVGSYVPLVDAILVATSLESSFGVIDSERLRMFMSAFRHGIQMERERREEQVEQCSGLDLDNQLHLDFGFNASR